MAPRLLLHASVTGETDDAEIARQMTRCVAGGAQQASQEIACIDSLYLHGYRNPPRTYNMLFDWVEF